MKSLSSCLFVLRLCLALGDLLPATTSMPFDTALRTFRPSTLASAVHRIPACSHLSAPVLCPVSIAFGVPKMLPRSRCRAGVASFLMPLPGRVTVNPCAAVCATFNVQPSPSFSFRPVRNSLRDWGNVSSLQPQVGYSSGYKPYAKHFATMESVPRVTTTDPGSMPLTECYALAEVGSLFCTQWCSVHFTSFFTILFLVSSIRLVWE